MKCENHIYFAFTKIIIWHAPESINGIAPGLSENNLVFAFLLLSTLPTDTDELMLMGNKVEVNAFASLDERSKSV